MLRPLITLCAIAALAGCSGNPGGSTLPRPAAPATLAQPGGATIRPQSNNTPWLAKSIVFEQTASCQAICVDQFYQISAQANGSNVQPSAIYTVPPSWINTYGDPIYHMSFDWAGRIWYGGNNGYPNLPVADCTPITRGGAGCSPGTAITDQPTTLNDVEVATDRTGHLAFSIYPGGGQVQNGGIDVYGIAWYGGAATHQRTIAGSNTTIGDMITGLAYDRYGNLWVAEPQAVLEFSASANGNVAPMHVLTSTTAFQGVTGVSLDKYGDIYVVDSTAGTLQMFNESQDFSSPVQPQYVWNDPNDLIGSSDVRVDDYNAYVLNWHSGNFYVYTTGINTPIQKIIAGPWYARTFALQ